MATLAIALIAFVLVLYIFSPLLGSDTTEEKVVDNPEIRKSIEREIEEAAKSLKEKEQS